MFALTKKLSRFLCACGGNWRNAAYIDGNQVGYLLALDRDAKPIEEEVAEAERELSRLKAEREKLARELPKEKTGWDWAADWAKGVGDDLLSGQWLPKTLDYVDAAATAGLASAGNRLNGFLDMTAGNGIKYLGEALGQDWSDNYFSRAAKNSSVVSEETHKKLMELAGENPVSRGLASILESTAAAAPGLLVAIMSGGASIPTSAGLATASAVELGQLPWYTAGMEAMMKDPNFWYSFLQEAGDSYQEAKSWGGSDAVATMYALTVGLINGGIEVGLDGASGIQGFEKAVRGGNEELLKAYLQSIGQEAAEEVLQGFTQRGLAALEVGSAPKNPYRDPDAVFDLLTSLEEAGMGAGVAALLGGGRAFGNSLWSSALDLYGNQYVQAWDRQTAGESHLPSNASLDISETTWDNDFQIGKSLGAAAKNYEVMDLETGEMFHFVEGTWIQDTEVFAGKGSRTEYRKAGYYAQITNTNAADWQHVKGIGLLDTPDGHRMAEVHWSQCAEIGKVDFFIKEWLD